MFRFIVTLSANNLKTVVVNFNKEVDSTTVSSSTVKVYVASSTTPTTVDTNLSDGVNAGEVGYVLSEDGEQLTLVFGTKFSQSGKVKVEINGVKSEDGQELKGFSQTKTVNDTTLPEATGVTVKNAKTFEIQFNEPVDFSVATAQISSNIKIDGVAAIATVTPDYVNNKVTVNLPTALSVGSHTVTVYDVADFAGFKTDEKSFTINVTDDQVAPSIKSARVIDRNTIEVEFDEELNAQGSFWVNNNLVTAVTAVGSSKTKYTLSGFGSLDLGAIVEVIIKYKDQTDALGNKTAEKTYKINVADDTTAPTVSHQLLTETGKKNNVTLTFSKPMQAVGTITVKDSTGSIVKTLNVASLSFKANTNNTVLELTASQLGLSSVDAGTYTINLKGLKDNTVRQNELPETNLTVTTVDTKAPTVGAKYVLTQGATMAEDKVTFTFSEAMDESTLNNLSNYGVDYGNTGSYQVLSTVTGARVDSISADKKSVTLVVPSARTANTEFQVYALKDVAGNVIATTSDIAKADTTGTEALTVSSATATSTNTIKVVASTAFSVVDPSSFKLIDASTSADKFTFANAQLDATDSTKRTVILTVNGTIDPAAEQYKLDDTANAALTKNVYDATLSISTPLTLTDKVKPAIAKIEKGNTIDGDTTVEANEFTITFTEAVKTSASTDATDKANALLDLAIRKADGTLLDASGFSIVDTDATSNNFDGAKAIVIHVADGTLDAGTNTLTVAIPAPRYITDNSSSANLVAENSGTTVEVDVVAAPAAPNAAISYADEEITGVDSTYGILY